MPRAFDCVRAVESARAGLGDLIANACAVRDWRLAESAGREAADDFAEVAALALFGLLLVFWLLMVVRRILARLGVAQRRIEEVGPAGRPSANGTNTSL